MSYLYNELPVVKKDATGEFVQLVQRAVGRWVAAFSPADKPLPVDGVYGTNTECYVGGFQSVHEGINGKSLAIDGVVGEQTWYALIPYSNGEIVFPESFISSAVGNTYDSDARDVCEHLPVNTKNASVLALASLNMAIQELKNRVMEEGRNHSSRIFEYHKGPQASTNLKGQPWCASFLSWCVWKASIEKGIEMPFKYTASSRNIGNELEKTLDSFYPLEALEDALQIIPGDILVWYRCPALESWKGHIGFVHHVDDNALYTIEGNKFNAVSARRYQLAEFEQPAFVRGFLGFGRV